MDGKEKGFSIGVHRVSADLTWVDGWLEKTYGSDPVGCEGVMKLEAELEMVEERARVIRGKLEAHRAWQVRLEVATKAIVMAILRGEGR